MFQLEFFEMVQRVMDWTRGRECTFLNPHQARALKNQPLDYQRPADGWRDNGIDRALHDYLRDTYPAYFGLSMRLGDSAYMCNQVLLLSH